MKLEKRIEAFTKLGTFLSQFQADGVVRNDAIELNEMFFEPFNMQLNRASEFNGWFTKDNVLTAFSKWSNLWVIIHHSAASIKSCGLSFLFEKNA